MNYTQKDWMALLTNTERTGKQRIMHDWKCNIQTNDRLLASGNKELWTVQVKMARTNFRNRSRTWGLMLDTGQELRKDIWSHLWLVGLFPLCCDTLSIWEYLPVFGWIGVPSNESVLHICVSVTCLNWFLCNFWYFSRSYSRGFLKETLRLFSSRCGMPVYLIFYVHSVPYGMIGNLYEFSLFYINTATLSQVLCGKWNLVKWHL
jgi:hypothetical protein